MYNPFSLEGKTAFGEVGTQNQLMGRFGLTAEVIVEKAKKPFPENKKPLRRGLPPPFKCVMMYLFAGWHHRICP